MSEQDDRNKHKTKLIIITLIAIIVVLAIGIIYQFVTIKKLQREHENSSAIVNVIENSNF